MVAICCLRAIRTLLKATRCRPFDDVSPWKIERMQDAEISKGQRTLSFHPAELDSAAARPSASEPAVPAAQHAESATAARTGKRHKTFCLERESRP